MVCRPTGMTKPIAKNHLMVFVVQTVFALAVQVIRYRLAEMDAATFER
jgi:hypothetical protein